MKISVRINTSKLGKKMPPERPFYATDMSNLVSIASSLYAERPWLTFSRDRRDYTVNFADFGRLVACVGSAFLEMRLDNDAVAVIGESSCEWFATYLAAVNSGNVIVPLDKELAPEQIANFIRRAHVRCVVYSHTFAETFAQMAEELPEVSCFACISKDSFLYPPKAEEVAGSTPLTERFVSFDDLVRRGSALLYDGNSRIADVKVDREKTCAILYTSGTTGTSKGVMLSQKNIISAVNAAFRLIDVTPDDRLVSVLPTHHTYEMTCGILTPLLAGANVCINENLKTVMHSLKKYKPTILVLVPLFVTTIYKRIMATIQKKGMEKKFRLGMTVVNAGRIVGLDLSKQLLSEVTDVFGGCLTRIVCGGAPMNPELVPFFDTLGIKLTQGYGITECAPLISVSPFNWRKAASVGMPVPGLEVKIGDDDLPYGEDHVDEIIVRGDNVMLGYQDDPERTAEVLDGDGWFRTGDLGYRDKDGFIYITGRKKNVIVLNNGKNVYPEEIEEYLENIQLISECVVLGRLGEDGETVRVTAVVYPDYALAEERGLHDVDAISEELRQEVNRLNTKLPSFKQIHSVEVRQNPFTKTTTKKIMRHKVDETT